SKVQPGTIKKYRSRAKLHINDSKLGNMVIDRVTKEHVMEWMDGLRSGKGANVAVGSELSSRSKGELHALLSSAFNTAVEEGVMLKNVAKGVGDAEANDGREPVYLSKEDLQLIEEAIPERYRLFIRLLSKTGLRYSEATALRKRDIRVQGKRCTVNVNRAWKATEAGEEIGVPKSKKARRNVSCGL